MLVSIRPYLPLSDYVASRLWLPSAEFLSEHLGVTQTVGTRGPVGLTCQQSCKQAACQGHLTAITAPCGTVETSI